MDPQEVRDRLKNVIIGLVKADTDPESAELAKTEFHDILAAKMRDRINPPAEKTDDETVTDGDSEVVVDDDTAE